MIKFIVFILIGALIGFTALIPVAGAYIGAIVGALMILAVSPIKALLFVLVSRDGTGGRRSRDFEYLA